MNERKATTLDRRRSVRVREIITQVVVAVIVGVASAFMATYISVSNLQVRFEYLNKNVDSLSKIVENVNRNELRITSLELHQVEQSKKLDKIEEKIEHVTKAN